jgi:RNA polymerase sigma factor (sigma-70 family)
MTNENSFGNDTETSGDKFPVTHWSAIVAASSDNAAQRDRALEVLANSYWRPIYKYLRVKWNKSSEDAKDLTQAFFVKAIEKGYFGSYDPAKSRFRTFIRVCVDGFISNEHKSAGRIKRGGDVMLVSLAYDAAEMELSCSTIQVPDTPDEYFEKEWIRSFFAQALDALRQECESSGRALHYALFEEYYIDGSAKKVSYEDLAAAHRLTVINVTNYLASARRRFRKIIMERLIAITGNEQEFRQDARLLLGVETK